MKISIFFVWHFVAILISGCKIEITVPEGGRVKTESGAYACESREICVIEVDDHFRFTVSIGHDARLIDRD